MPITFSPKPGTVLLCDYDLGRTAHVPPDMTKRRPVVVVSPRSRHHFRSLILVVPLSTVAPAFADELSVRIRRGRRVETRLRSSDLVAIIRAATLAIGGSALPAGP